MRQASQLGLSTALLRGAARRQPLRDKACYRLHSHAHILHIITPDRQADRQIQTGWQAACRHRRCIDWQTGRLRRRGRQSGRGRLSASSAQSCAEDDVHIVAGRRHRGCGGQRSPSPPVRRDCAFPMVLVLKVLKLVSCHHGRQESLCIVYMAVLYTCIVRVTAAVRKDCCTSHRR